MKTNYDFYCLGCREAGVRPVSSWRFHNALAKYHREFHSSLDLRVDLLPAKERERIVGRWTRLVRLSELVVRGREPAAYAARSDRGDDEPGTAGAGTREPRTPLTPVLAGSAVPMEEALKEHHTWRF